jgi:hypothetical protein
VSSGGSGEKEEEQHSTSRARAVLFFLKGHVPFTIPYADPHVISDTTKEEENRKDEALECQPRLANPQ